jgi:hypothetical protein
MLAPMLAATVLCVAESAEAPVKLSGSGICHEPGSRFYDQTVNFRPYATLDACVRAGGRLPRGTKPRNPMDSAARAAQATASPSAEPIRVEPTRVESDTRPRPAAPWLAIGAGAAVMGGLAWWAVGARATRRRRAEEAADRRRWQDHRLSRYDRADEAKLLLAVGGSRATFERLVEYELSRNPQLAREQAISDAYARWKRDNG